jgi:3-hydroxyisobutyrate dehydrogenase-like beta-hydroxyacid dehydrogenase
LDQRPVSGGIAGRRAGTLAITCGGEAAALAAAEPAIRAYAREHHADGRLGAGQTTKLINQVLVGSAMAAAEAVALAQAAGIDAGRLPTALAGGWADSKPLQVFVPRMVDGYQQADSARSPRRSRTWTRSAAAGAAPRGARCRRARQAQQLMRPDGRARAGRGRSGRLGAGCIGPGATESHAPGPRRAAYILRGPGPDLGAPRRASPEPHRAAEQGEDR